MTKDLIFAGTHLAETLETENAALAALDLPRAAGMLADKRSAVADFDAVRTGPAPSEAAQRMARRLQGLAMENKRLLERAIAVQGRVIGVIARAATAATEPAGYGPARGRRPAPMAFSARA
jgi:hypothetical protein